MQEFFGGRKILICVSGGIAVYKTLDMVSMLRKWGAEIKIIMTENAARFVAPLTFEAVSGARVYHDMWDRSSHDIDHISLKDFPEITIVAPATANIIGKFSSCIADDLLSTTLLGIKTPVYFVPSMNTDMYENPMFQKALNKIRENGYNIIEPDEGHLACGVKGKGRMPSGHDILSHISEKESAGQSLRGKKVLITLGATREFFDDARFLSNPSTGKMGKALAESFRKQGAAVRIIAAHNEVDLSGFSVSRVTTAEHMYEKVMSECKGTDIYVSTAAVSDFRPVRRPGKMKKENTDINDILFQKNPDILKSICSSEDRPAICVGFAAESENIIENAKKKLVNKGADIIIANSISDPGTGFSSDNNEVFFITENNTEHITLAEKTVIAEKIIQLIIDTEKN